jgi:hypothetical protein
MADDSAGEHFGDDVAAPGGELNWRRGDRAAGSASANGVASNVARMNDTQQSAQTQGLACGAWPAAPWSRSAASSNGDTWGRIRDAAAIGCNGR